MKPSQERASETPRELVITVSANFTAEPISDVLRFWMSRLALGPTRLEFSGYNQIFQVLMAPPNLSSSPPPGVHVLLVRFEDWARDQTSGARAEAVVAAVREFLPALTAFAQRAGRPTVVVLCPPSRTAAEDPELARTLLSLEQELRRAMDGLRGTSILAPDDVSSLYPVDVVDDPESDRQGHIPFTPAYWAALGTALARKIHSLFHPPHKVIVVDADNTLWGGVVGEIGARQVRVDKEWRFLQDFLRIRKNQGLLLALASKNEVADVEEVFRRPDMVLRREDFVAWKVNWERKSRNVLALSKELELGLDSFVFLDDNPVECADVAANCPAVTTLRLPANPERIPDFLRHAWAFDPAGATKVDEKRTELYQQQSERNQFRNAVSSFRDFIDGLQLRVDIAPPVPAQYERSAQLTQRTNQFNTSGIRRTPAELGSLLESGQRRALLVRARDRFGDYGEVGLAVFFVDEGGLNVESLLMSCRALGKGVEHRLLAGLGEEALRLGLDDLVIPFKRTDRNLPAENFLKSVGAVLRDTGAYHLSSTSAAGTVFDPESGLPRDISEEAPPSDAVGRSRPEYAVLAELGSVEKIMNEVARHFRRARPELPNELVGPRSAEEARLARIWEEVLHLDPIGVLDPFLNLGGGSLHAASVAARIAAEFGVRMPLDAVFSTIAELGERLGRADHRGEAKFLPKARKAVLSPAQQRLWFLDQFIPNRAAYNIPLARRIHGCLNPGALEAALSKVALRHELLRSTYGFQEGLTAINLSATPRVTLQRLSAASESDALAMAGEEARRPFDLTQGPLLRCLAISWGTEDHILVFNIQHIIADGWSTGILLGDLAEAYAAEASGREPSWEPLPASYFDYAEWQQERLAAGDFRADLDYWKSELRTAPSSLELPTDHSRPSVMTYQGGSLTGRIDPSVRRAVEDLAGREACTPFMVLLAAWQALLHRYCRQEDIVVGVPVAGRTHASVEGVVGCFVNTLAIRTAVDGEAPFLSHLGSVRGKVLDALAHQDLPFEHLVSELGLERDMSRSPLFQVMLVLQDTPHADFGPAGLEVTSVPLHNGGAKFDLVLEVTPSPEGYGLALEFNSGLFLPGTAERMLHHFRRLLEAACASPQTSLASLPMMDEAEVAAMLSFVNGDRAAFPDVECLHHGFERRVSMSPDAPALSCDGRTLSYGDVNRRANRLAHHLIACGVGPDVLVGLCIDRSLELVIAILGLLKAGGAYLPIDLSYPAERLAFMLDDAQAPVLLTEKKLLGSLPPHRARVICLDDAEAVLDAQPETNPATSVTPDNLAYVIFTSGSTGQPKGCMITHRNVARLMRATEPVYGFRDSDIWTLFHSTAFDFSVWEIWGALLYGGRLVVVPFMVSRSPEVFYELLAAEQVTILNQTPSAFRQLIQAEESLGQKNLALRCVIFGGEALEMQSLRPWFDRHGDQKPRLVNMYGITETTVHVTYRPLSRDDLSSGSVIGAPIADLQIYILDAGRRPVPIGVTGEMYVGGAGLARGYLHRPELTAERFIAGPFGKGPLDRLYRTGDLARFLPGRDIEYLGRIDTQVKIRGFRIELGEIESLLRQHPAIREAVVIAREDAPGSKQLVAYLVPHAAPPSVHELRAYLRERLPDYMVPSAFVPLRAIPLTHNGKVDRAAFPAPAHHRPDLDQAYTAPRTDEEKTLADIWGQALRLEHVGIHDNFFEMGGDSILIIQIVARANQAGFRLSPRQIFDHPTIAELAAEVALPDRAAPERQDPDAGPMPLTPIQHHFFDQNHPEPRHWNMAVQLEARRALDSGLLQRVVKELLVHHDALRLRFVRQDDAWRQLCANPNGAIPFTRIDLSPWPETERQHALEVQAAELQASLNLAEGPLVRVALFDSGAGRPGLLLFLVHHLAVDGVSWRILLEDLNSAYAQLERGEPVKLPPKTTSYRQWAERLGEAAKTVSIQREEDHWRGGSPNEASPLPRDFPAGENAESSARTINVLLSLEETRALLRDVPPVYHTRMNEVLLAAAAIAFVGWTGRESLLIDLEGRGREEIFEGLDLSRTVGWFTTIFPVHLHLGEVGDMSQVGQVLKTVKEQLRRIPNRGFGYGLLRYSGREETAAGLRRQPRAEVIFGDFDPSDRIPEGDSPLGRFREFTKFARSPRAKRDHLIEIRGWVSEGRLRASWTYSEESHDEATIAKLADAFLDGLRSMIRHCRSHGPGEYTPSDFPLAGLDAEELDQLMKELSPVRRPR